MELKHSKIIELSGGSLSGNMVTVARAVNQNGYVLKDLCNYIEQLEKRVDELEGYVSSMAGYLANENII